MTSKIKVDNINKVSDDSNIIKKCGTTTTIGSGASNPIVVDGSAVTLGRCGGTVALASGATQTGFGRTGTVDWDTTPKTATFTAVSGDGFFANTTGSAFNMNLPAGVAGAIVSVADYAGTWNTNPLTVVPNGTDKIGGVNENAALNTEGQSVTFVFVDSTQGWVNTMDSTSNVRGTEFIGATGGTITQSGNDNIHTFTGPGTFTVSVAAVCAANNLVSYAVVAGGGGGGGVQSYGGSGAGGGGAGGYRETKSPATPYTASPLCGHGTPGNRITVSAQAYPIVVGGGGTTPSGNGSGGDGSVSTFSTITSAGGGGGAGYPQVAGRNGGSGGGAGGCSPGQNGNGNTPPTTPAQGTDGGPGPEGGGGGGATAVGGPGSGPGQAGGAGATSSINGTPTARAGGGGGGGGSYPGGPGGTGGGGSSGPAPGGSSGGAGTDNTGGGGGGGPTNDSALGGLGGSGIVIIRYKAR